MPEEYVSVVFNEIHQVAMTKAIYPHNQFEVVPYEMFQLPGLMAAIIVCPEGRGQYQADRFSSFMFGARVWPTRVEAEDYIAAY